MKLHRLNKMHTNGYATFGCMWRKGECMPDAKFECRSAGGVRVPIQSRVTACWPDGSVKWTAHTGNSAQMGSEIEIGIAAQETPAAEGIRVEAARQGYVIVNGTVRIDIPGPGEALFACYEKDGKARALNARPELILEEPAALDGRRVKIEKAYAGRVDSVSLEENGPLQVTVKYTGTHADVRGETRLPFVIRMRISAGESSLHFMHTFVYDGDEDKDFLKGIGIAFDVPMKGEMYNRHLKFAGDNGVFHEAMVGLTSWRPRIPAEIYARQMKGEIINETDDAGERIEKVMQDVPFWSEYDICQDYAEHYAVRKKLSLPNGCYIDAQHGRRAKGSVAFGSEHASVIAAMRDFWEKYPSGYNISGMDSDMATMRVWFWHPSAAAMDFRHYAERGYNQVCYEGYDYKGATPYGIACTNECAIRFADEMIPEDAQLLCFQAETNEPVHYVADPEWYHDEHAFGYWSLPSYETETEAWLEKQLDAAFDFYKQEVEQRGWYGMFNYGDFMHTYDAVRHQWKYDVGGYAWDNTELVPTLWLWTYFLRTGREDAFRLAEKLTRHASEVDVYHMGKYKGLGSRHNVRHWGCPCKEARIAMAHHHRYYYYLTGDLRLADLFSELKDNELSFLNKDPLGDFFEKSEMVYPSHARSGPDWSSLCSNWLVEWERTGDARYLHKMLVGMADIKAAPLKLISGPDFEFDPHTWHLRYIGERTTGGTHLQICMGAPTIWTDMADLIDDEEWRKMMADYGRFYFLPNEQKQAESGGLIGTREFSIPFMASCMGAYGAAYLNDELTARRAWAMLLKSLMAENGDGFAIKVLENQGNQASLAEIAWISTNFAAQFCLNVIMSLEWTRKQLPKTMAEARELAARAGQF